MTDEGAPEAQWILTAGQYSAYHVVGAFRTKELAEQAAESINDTDTGYDDFTVEEVSYLDALRVEIVDTVQLNYFALYWDGRQRYERVGEPTARTRLSGLPSGEGSHTVDPWPVCEVTIGPFEYDYTLGVTLEVRGSDVERVRKVYTEQKAMLVSDPATATIKAWRDREYPVPPWVWGRGTHSPEFLNGLEAAGFDRINGGPIGS